MHRTTVLMKTKTKARKTMKNSEKYRTIGERVKAHLEWCNAGRTCKDPDSDRCDECAFRWLERDDDKLDDEKPMKCPFCGSSTEVVIDECGCYSISCIHCEYGSPAYNEDKYAIEAHNRICRAVAAYKESEVK